MSETGGRNYIAGRPVNTDRPLSPFLAGVFARRRPPAAIIHEFHVLPVDDVEKIFDDGNFFVHGLVLSARFILKRIIKGNVSTLETKGLRQRPLDGTVRFSEKGGCIQKRGEDSKRSKGAVVMATNLCVGAGEGGKQTRQKEEEEEEEEERKKRRNPPRADRPTEKGSRYSIRPLLSCFRRLLLKKERRAR